MTEGTAPSDATLVVPEVGTLLEPLVPELALAVGLVSILILDLIRSRQPVRLLSMGLAGLTLICFACLAIVAIEADFLRPPNPALLFSSEVGQYYWRLLVAASTAGVLLLHAGERIAPQERSEVPVFCLGLTLGLSLLAMSRHLVSFFVAFELVSLCSYFLVASYRSSPRASEAALKYVLYGAFSSALLLIGLALLFLYSGGLYFHEIREALVNQPPESLLFAWVWIYAGLAFKVGALPFQFWVPDVYQGASSSVAAVLSVAPKAVGLFLLIQMHALCMPTPELALLGGKMLAVLAALLIFIANVQAWRQTDFRRLLAYSSLSHTGYLLLAVSVGTAEGQGAMLNYLIIYAIMQFGAFALAEILEQSTGSTLMVSASGMGRIKPRLGIGATVLMVSLAGLPPFWGFWAKFFLFAPLSMKYDQTDDRFWLVILLVAVLNTVVGLYYYLKLPFQMWLRPGSPTVQGSWVLHLIVASTSIALLLGLVLIA